MISRLSVSEYPIVVRNWRVALVVLLLGLKLQLAVKCLFVFCVATNFSSEHNYVTMELQYRPYYIGTGCILFLCLCSLFERI